MDDRFNKLFFDDMLDDRATKAYINKDENIIKICEEYKSSIGTPTSLISFYSLNDMGFIEKDNMTFACWNRFSPVIDYLLLELGIKNYKLQVQGIDNSYNKNLGAGFYQLEFFDKSDYCFFKLKFFKQIVEYREVT